MKYMKESDIENKRGLWFYYQNKKSSSMARKCLLDWTPFCAPNVFGFIALQDEIYILERWIRFTKNSQIKIDTTSVGWDAIKMDLEWKIKT